MKAVLPWHRRLQVPSDYQGRGTGMLLDILPGCNHSLSLLLLLECDVIRQTGVGKLVHWTKWGTSTGGGPTTAAVRADGQPGSIWQQTAAALTLQQSHRFVLLLLLFALHRASCVRAEHGADLSQGTRGSPRWPKSCIRERSSPSQTSISGTCLTTSSWLSYCCSCTAHALACLGRWVGMGDQGCRALAAALGDKACLQLR